MGPGYRPGRREAILGVPGSGPTRPGPMGIHEGPAHYPGITHDSGQASIESGKVRPGRMNASSRVVSNKLLLIASRRDTTCLPIGAFTLYHVLRNLEEAGDGMMKAERVSWVEPSMLLTEATRRPRPLLGSNLDDGARSRLLRKADEMSADESAGASDSPSFLQSHVHTTKLVNRG